MTSDQNKAILFTLLAIVYSIVPVLIVAASEGTYMEPYIVTRDLVVVMFMITVMPFVLGMIAMRLLVTSKAKLGVITP